MIKVSLGSAWPIVRPLEKLLTRARSSGRLVKRLVTPHED